MNQQPDSQKEPRAARRFSLRSRLLLWGLLSLIALLCGIRIVHEDPQPTHQGKTAEEWFGEVSSIYSGLEFVTKDPAVIGLRHLGTNAVWYLWQERTRKESPLLATMRWRLNALRRWQSLPRPAPSGDTAWQILFVFGPETEVLLPEALELLKGQDPNEAANAALLLSFIKQQPDVVVPAIVQSLTMTNRQLEHRTKHLASLRNLGPQAQAAVPALRAHIQNPMVASTYETHWAAEAILTINGPGPELGYYTNAIRPGNYAVSHSPVIYLSRLGTNARPAAPVLRQFALTLTNANEIREVTNAVHLIDPEGLTLKP